MPPSAPVRKPRGYIGTNHETIGSDILSVLRVVTTPDATFGPELAAKLRTIQAGKWYPIALMLEVLEVLDQKTGEAGLIATGRKLFQLTHAFRVGLTAQTAADILYGFDTIYKRANRGTDIGGWTVLEFSPGLAKLEKTTPHHCKLEEGIILEALSTVGIPAVVEQSACLRKGADSCVMVITGAADQRWGKPPSPGRSTGSAG